MRKLLPVSPTTSPTVRSIESHTPAAPRTDQTTATATTVTMPSATASRKAVFITDHGSMCVNLSRARRGRFGPYRVEVAPEEVGDDAVAGRPFGLPLSLVDASTAANRSAPEGRGSLSVSSGSAGLSGSTGPEDAYAALIRSVRSCPGWSAGSGLEESPPGRWS